MSYSVIELRFCVKVKLKIVLEMTDLVPFNMRQFSQMNLNRTNRMIYIGYYKYQMAEGNWLTLIHPFLTGFFGFTATCIGAHFFKADNTWLYIGSGLLLFILANQFMLKFQFNSYQLNGATITTIGVFLSQTLCMTIWKSDVITPRWLFGAVLVLLGSILVKAGDMDEAKKSEGEMKQADKTKQVDKKEA